MARSEMDTKHALSRMLHSLSIPFQRIDISKRYDSEEGKVITQMTVITVGRKADWRYPRDREKVLQWGEEIYEAVIRSRSLNEGMCNFSLSTDIVTEDKLFPWWQAVVKISRDPLAQVSVLGEWGRETTL